SSDVCSSDLVGDEVAAHDDDGGGEAPRAAEAAGLADLDDEDVLQRLPDAVEAVAGQRRGSGGDEAVVRGVVRAAHSVGSFGAGAGMAWGVRRTAARAQAAGSHSGVDAANATTRRTRSATRIATAALTRRPLRAPAGRGRRPPGGADGSTPGPPRSGGAAESAPGAPRPRSRGRRGSSRRRTPPGARRG